MTATVTTYLGTLRESSLIGVSEEDLQAAEQALDAKLDDYIEYLRTELAEEGITLETEPGQATYSEVVAADSYEEEEEARRTMASLKDFWEWYS